MTSASNPRMEKLITGLKECSSDCLAIPRHYSSGPAKIHPVAELVLEDLRRTLSNYATKLNLITIDYREEE